MPPCPLMPAPGVGPHAPRQRLASAGCRRQAAGWGAGDGQPARLELPTRAEERATRAPAAGHVDEGAGDLAQGFQAAEAAIDQLIGGGEEQAQGGRGEAGGSLLQQGEEGRIEGGARRGGPRRGGQCSRVRQ